MSDNNKSRNLYLFNSVFENSVKSLVEKIIETNEEDDMKDAIEKDFVREPIKIFINSFGGMVYDGFGLIDLIDSSKTPIHTYVTGKAMSMALLIAVSGHKRFCFPKSTYMYHQVSSGSIGYLEKMKNDTEESERLMKIYDKYLLSKTNVLEEKIKLIQEKQTEWYLNSKEAFKFGLVDEIVE